MPIEVLGKKFYPKEYGVGLKPSSSKRSSAQSYEKVRVLKNEVETLKDVCQEQKNQLATMKDLCQMQQEKIQAYDEKFARFETVLCAYIQQGPIGPGSNPHLLGVLMQNKSRPNSTINWTGQSLRGPNNF